MSFSPKPDGESLWPVFKTNFKLKDEVKDEGKAGTNDWIK